MSSSDHWGIDGNARHQQPIATVVSFPPIEAINYLEVYWLFATGRLLQSSGGLEKDGNVVSLERESALGTIQNGHYYCRIWLSR